MLRQQLAKSSVKKYQAMINAVCADGRARGMFQFYGANRTGRWLGGSFNCKTCRKTISQIWPMHAPLSAPAITTASKCYTKMYRTRYRNL